MIIRFGISRAHGGARLVEGARLLTAALEGRLDEPVRLELSEDYEEMLARLLAGELELVWMPPMLHGRALAAGATLAAVSERGGVLVFRSAILVRAESPYRSLGDLAGARAAWSDRHSAAGHLFPRWHLSQAGVIPGGEQIFGAPMAAMSAVAEGRADFCAGFVSDAAGEDLARALAEVQRSFPPAAELLRVLDVTGPIPPDGMVLAASLDEAQRARLTGALLTLHHAPAGKAAIRVLMGADRLAVPTEPILNWLAALPPEQS